MRSLPWKGSRPRINAGGSDTLVAAGWSNCLNYSTTKRIGRITDWEIEHIGCRETRPHFITVLVSISIWSQSWTLDNGGTIISKCWFSCNSSDGRVLTIRRRSPELGLRSFFFPFREEELLEIFEKRQRRSGHMGYYPSYDTCVAVSRPVLARGLGPSAKPSTRG